MMRCARFAFLIGLVFALPACSSSDHDAEKVKGTRIPVLQDLHKTQADRTLESFAFQLPDQTVNSSWAQSAANPEHLPPHAALSALPEKEWSRSIGSGSSSDYKLLATPVVAAGKVYAMDARGRVSATTLADGDPLWRVETNAPGFDGDAMGGGIAVDGDVVYASTGYGEVLALRAATGAVIWRQMLLKPIRSAPTVAEGRVFVINIENETHALDARTGGVLWKHSGLAESASIMGASSPAVRGDTVVVAYSSGELFGLRTQNGRVLWGEVLAVPTQLGALPAIADIRGQPVFSGRRALAISHSGRMAAIDERTGERAWEADIGGLNTPCVAGNVVYVVTTKSELVALDQDTGRIVWLSELQRTRDPEDKASKAIAWFGPVLAGGRLWLTNTLGQLAAYAPDTGLSLYEERVGDSFFLPPIVAGRTMILLDDSGDLIALK